MSKCIVAALFCVICGMANGTEEVRGLKLYVSENSASDFAQTMKQSSNPKDRENGALIASRIASVPQAIWITHGFLESAETALSESSQKGELPVFVLYNIPGRDNGQYSGGGEGSPQSYKKFIDNVSRHIGNHRAWIIVEPDALMLMHELSENDQKIRQQLLQYAVEHLKKNPNVRVYLDGGHSNWHSPEETARRLKLGGIANADGFALNTSNFRKIEELMAFGEKVSKLTGGKHFVLDTSRNGNGPWESNDSQAWCNPPGRALGHLPTLNTGHPLIDAYLWVKHPGESDGECRGGPQAGQFWPEYALELIRNAK